MCSIGSEADPVTVTAPTLLFLVEESKDAALTMFEVVSSF